MANIRTKDLTLLSSVDAAVDAILIEDISANETKKTTANILKTSMSLDSVDNTSDVNKPISTATQAALDGKVDENAAITGATKTKITYDSKGLVTAGADLAASDMPTGIDAAKIGGGSVDNTEFGYLNGVTSAIQTQLNAKQGSLTLTTTGSSGAATLIGNTLNIPQYTGGSGGGVTSLEGLSGALQLVAGSGISISDNGTDTITITNTGGGGGSVAWGSITGTLSSQTDLQTALDGKVDENSAITGATKTKITYDSKGLVTAGADLAASDLPTGIDAAKIGAGSVDNTEFGYLNGVTSAIQTQLDAKQGSLTLTTTGSSGAATLVGNTLNIPQYSGGGSIPDGDKGDITVSNSGATWTIANAAVTNAKVATGIDAAKIADGTVSNAEFQYIGGLTSDAQTQINAKQDTLVSGTNIKTINSTSVLGSGDIAVQATLVSGTNIKTINSTSILGSGNISVAPASGINATAIGTGSVDNTEFGYLDGVTSAIQTQIDTKTNKLITANRQTASYTLVASDADKLVEMNVASANNLTVPASTFSAGQQILLSQYGAGQTTIVAGSGMTIRSNGGKLKLSAQYSGATLVFISATEAYLFGDIAS